MLQGSDHLCIKTRLTMTESSNRDKDPISARGAIPKAVNYGAQESTEERSFDNPTIAIRIITKAANASDEYASESRGQSGLSCGKKCRQRTMYQLDAVELSPDGDLNPVDEMPVAGRSRARS